MARLEFLFDFVSPYSYLAAHTLYRKPRYQSADVEWTPMFLGGVFKAVGNRAPIELAPKGAHMLLDLQRLARYYAIPLRFPASFPINTLLPMRAATALKAAGDAQYAAYCDAMFRAYWGEGHDISDARTWAAVATNAGVDAVALREAAESQASKDTLKASTDRAVAIGAFGAPTFLVDGAIYWGFDRMFLVDEALGLRPDPAP